LNFINTSLPLNWAVKNRPELRGKLCFRHYSKYGNSFWIISFFPHSTLTGNMKILTLLVYHRRCDMKDIQCRCMCGEWLILLTAFITHTNVSLYNHYTCILIIILFSSLVPESCLYCKNYTPYMIQIIIFFFW
jgi:hypothetical protein